MSTNNNLEKGFVYLSDINSSIIVDLKYYSSKNFTGKFVEGYNSNKAILTKEAAVALSNVQDDLNKIGYSLILYDAYRPQSAVDFFVKWSLNIYDTIYKNTLHKKSPGMPLGFFVWDRKFYSALVLSAASEEAVVVSSSLGVSRFSLSMFTMRSVMSKSVLA